jgi:hypothetical protein
VPPSRQVIVCHTSCLLRQAEGDGFDRDRYGGSGSTGAGRRVASILASFCGFVGNAPWSDAATLARVGKLVLRAIGA